MSFARKNNIWHLQSKEHSQALSDLVTGQDKPFYLYNLNSAIQNAEQLLASGLSVHYAMKSNSHARLLTEFSKRGLGVDVVSLGEMRKALDHGFQASRLIFSGVAKDSSDLEAALDAGVYQINCESFEELQLLGQIAWAKKIKAQVALRLNILLTAPTHAHIQTATPESKFGIDVEQLSKVLEWLKTCPSIELKGLATHIGSQILDHSIFEKMAAQMGELYRQVKSQGFPLSRLDLGGGFGIDYQSSGDEDMAQVDQYLNILKKSHGTDATVSIEPGRILVARMGALLARVIYVKQTSRQKFVILNAGMNCLMRPALYQSYHRIVPVIERSEKETYTVVGPICESTDKFAVDRVMPRVERGDWIAILDAGAYGAVMANTYNESPLPAEWVWYNGKVEIA